MGLAKEDHAWRKKIVFLFQDIKTLSNPEDKAQGFNLFANLNAMKKAFFSIFFFFSILPFFYGQKPLSITIDFDRDTLEVFSPWSFTLQVTNTTDQDVSEYPLIIEDGWVIQYGYIKLQIRQGEKSLWQNTNTVSSRQYNIFSGMVSYSKVLHPLESMTGKFICAPPVSLIKPGKVEVRVLYYPLETAEIVASSPVTVFINDYHGIDSLAYDYIRNQPRPDFILYPALPVSYDTSDISRAEYIINKFPNSAMEPFTVLYLATLNCQMASNKSLKVESHGQVLQYLRLSKKYALKAIEIGDNKIIKKATRTLQMFEQIQFTLYPPGLPPELEDEFVFPFKK